MRTTGILAVFLAFVFALPVAAQDVDVKVFDEAWKLVDRSFYDRNHHGVDWAAMKEKYRPDAEKCKTQKELHAVINRMIGELKASHCVLLEGDVYRDHIAPEFSGRKTLRCGFELTGIEKKLFVVRLYEGSAAEKAGLKLGDEIVRINGKPAGKTEDLVDAGSDPGIPGDPHYFVRVKKETPLHLVIRRARNGGLLDIKFQPDKISQVHATKNSIRVITYKKKKLGYIHLWHFLSGKISRTLRDALENEFADCDGLVLDIRGRGGSPMVMNQVFSYFVKGRARKWNKPVVCLVDEGSRSAKDVFAFNWKKRKVGELVGTPTSGAVLGSTFFKLSDGSYMLLAVMSVRSLTGGVNLEGHPVKPTVLVKRDVRWCQGIDAILEKGIRVLYSKLKPWY